MNLSLVLHAHQPPGNFDSVFQRAVDTCYGPVLDLIEERPSLRLSIHWSGSLLEWMEAHAPERIAQIRRLVDARQVEVVAAGMYEPVLALLPRHDRTGQLRAHRAYLARLFGVDARAGWLTERVWEPAMAADLAEGGIQTVTLDDRHLLSAGLMPDDLDVPYLTESQGRSLLIAPVAEDLRMAVPWESVEDALDLLRRKAADGVRLAVYADDIEKFGMWPGTFEDIIHGGWLAAFFDGLVDLDAAGEVRVLPLGEAVEGVPDGGRVYVPDGSYPEMLEWSLPPAGQRALRAARDAAEEAGVLAQVSPFMRAGQYLQFLAKYPEVDHLHKRMLDVSARMAGRTRALRAWDPEDVPPAVRDLWSAQANCAYWHGLFGGIYLAHIRQRLWHHLLRAERAQEEDGARRRPL
ncbi:MAG: alpha-amylase/4-alpha-glucanotransferase domain-containing protein, partial [Dehalococcoidia bacterium]